MNNFNNAQVEKVIHDGYEFRISDYLQRAFEIVRDGIKVFCIFGLVFFIADQLEDVRRILGAFGWVLKLVFSYVIFPCLMAGGYWITREIAENRAVQFDDFLKGFNWIKEIFLASLIKGGVTFLAMLPFVLLGIRSMKSALVGNFDIPFQHLEGGNSLFALFSLPLIYLSVSWIFTPLFIVFYNMKAWDAMEASRKIITKKWLWFFGVACVLGLIGGIINGFFQLSVILTLPIMVCLIYAAFDIIVGMPQDNQNDVSDPLFDIRKI